MKRTILACILLGITTVIPVSSTLYTTNNRGPDVEIAISKDSTHHNFLNAFPLNTKKDTIQTAVHPTEETIVLSTTVSTVPPKSHDRNCNQKPKSVNNTNYSDISTFEFTANSGNTDQFTDTMTLSGVNSECINTICTDTVTDFIPPITTIAQFKTNAQSNATTTKTFEKIPCTGNTILLSKKDECEIVTVDLKITPEKQNDTVIEKNIQNKNYFNNNEHLKNTNDKGSIINLFNPNIKVNIQIKQTTTEPLTTTETTTTCSSTTTEVSVSAETTSQTTLAVETTTDASSQTTLAVETTKEASSQTTLAVETTTDASSQTTFAVETTTDASSQTTLAVETTTDASSQTTLAVETTTDIVSSADTNQGKDAIQLPFKYGTEIIDVKVAPATQDNVDNFSIIQDNGELFSTEQNIFLFGHSYKSFRYLSDLKKGDTIILWNDDVPKTYTIEKNEAGNLNCFNTDILDKNGESLLYNDTDENTLRLITCETDIFLRYNRRVVVAVAAEN